MSNDVYGYLEPPLKKSELASLKNYILNSSLNIRSVAGEALFNFPMEFTPNNEVFIFDISDGHNSINATYLIDYLEYDPVTSDIGFPPGGKDRLDILLGTLADVIKITGATTMVVALTECNQIETIKKIKLSELYDVIHADFETHQGPPDTLYEISNQ